MSESPPPPSPLDDNCDDSEGSLVNVAEDQKPAAEETQAPKEEAPVVKMTKRQLVDKFLSNFVKYTSSASNQDKSIKLLQYTLWLAAYLKKSKSLAKLANELSMARYVTRLLGFPASLEAASTGSWDCSSSKSTWIHRMGRIMAYSMMVYYPFEHVAYLRWTSPNLLPGKNAAKWSAYSCRAWLVYLIAEMTQSTLKLKEMYRQRDDEDDALNAAIRNEQLQVVRSLLFTLPAIHWSLPKWNTDPWLKEGALNGMMWAEAVVSMFQSICAFR